MDLGLFVLLGFFAYSSLIIKARTDSAFIVMPVLALGIICAAILGTAAISSEQVLISMTVTTATNSTETLINGTTNQTISITNIAANSPQTIPLIHITESWGVALFFLVHMMLAFLNMLNALYVIKDQINAKERFKYRR